MASIPSLRLQTDWQRWIVAQQKQTAAEEAGEPIAPQLGPQSTFYETDADIAIYGGAAGGGKSFGILLDFARHVENSRYGGVILRRTSPQITNEGGLWDTSAEIYPSMGGQPIQGVLEWRFPSGATIRFAHLQHEKNKHDWQGSQLPRLGFDELNHFTETQFFYMLSRCRTPIGVRPQIRATCNPDADSWLITGSDGWGSGLIAWWIDSDTGYAIPERSGVIRWFVRISGHIHWADTAEELKEKFPGSRPKSLTFILSKITDNPILLSKDPGYLANLMAQHPIERARLLEGNWKIRKEAGKFINRGWLEVVEHAPDSAIECRFWDFAATAKEAKGDDPDWTVGTKLRRVGELYYVVDVIRTRSNPGEVERIVKNTAAADGRNCIVGVEQEPGSAGKMMVARWRSLLKGYNLQAPKPIKDKLERAQPFAVQCEAGNIKILRAPWNDPFLATLHAVPDSAHDDDLDSVSGAFNVLNQGVPSVKRSGLKLY